MEASSSSSSSRGVRIGVPQQSVTVRAPVAVAPPPVAAVVIPETGHKTLYELCGSNYNRTENMRSRKRRKAEEELRVAEEAAAAGPAAAVRQAGGVGSPAAGAAAAAAAVAVAGGGDGADNAGAGGGGSGGVAEPQVEVGPDGRIRVMESSLQATTGASADGAVVIEDGVNVMATYSSFMSKTFSSAWGLEETRQFYRTLASCGTDFTLMQAFFPNRTRKQLKTKFYREEKQHPELVRKALETPASLELDPFNVHLGPIDDQPDSGGNGGDGEETTVITMMSSTVAAASSSPSSSSSAAATAGRGADASEPATSRRRTTSASSSSSSSSSAAAAAAATVTAACVNGMAAAGDGGSDSDEDLIDI